MTTKTITLSETLYQIATRRAASVGQTPDQLIERLLVKELLFSHPHIELVDSPGGLWAKIKETRIGVDTVVGYHQAGYTVEEIAQDLLHLSLAQVYDALGYYYDNQEAMDADIAKNSIESWDQRLREDMEIEDYRQLTGQNK